MVPLSQQLVNLLAAALLLIAFAMLSQRRVLSLIRLFAWQGLALAISTVVVAHSMNQPHLYISAVITVVLKVLFLPWFLPWPILSLLIVPAWPSVWMALMSFSTIRIESRAKARLG
jgi:hydrogenase-4 component E